MNISQAKTNFNIAGFLESIGLEPVYKNGNQWKYQSPLHQDNKPSFSVNVKTNLWHDFATGNGGDVIDLVKLTNQTDTAGAIAALTGTGNAKPVFSFHRQNITPATYSKIEIKKVQMLKNMALIQYLHDRKIPLNIALKYFLEAYYTTSLQGKQFFALAFKNDRGGYALRNRIWKGAASPAYFTSIPGKWHDQLNIFEGVFDFVSALVYFKSETPKLDCLVLNSTAHLHKIIPVLAGYNRINLFFDNDQPGELAATAINQNHANVVNFSKVIYPDQKDFNEFIIVKQPGKN